MSRFFCFYVIEAITINRKCDRHKVHRYRIHSYSLILSHIE